MTSSHGSCDDCVSFYIVADGRTHSFSYPSFLLGDDAGSERNPPPHDVFRRMRTEQHTVVNGVGDVSDEATNQWCKNISCDDHKSVSNTKGPQSLKAKYENKRRPMQIILLSYIFVFSIFHLTIIIRLGIDFYIIHLLLQLFLETFS